MKIGGNFLGGELFLRKYAYDGAADLSLQQLTDVEPLSE